MRRTLTVILAAALAAAALWAAGCQTGSQARRVQPVWQPQKVAVLQFRAVPPDPQQGTTACSPLTGAVYACGIPQDKLTQAERTLTEALLDILAQDADFEVVPPSQAQPVFTRLRRENLGMDLAKVVAMTGRKLGAEGVLVGHVYRWRQRLGGEMAADRPASAAFDLAMVRTDDAQVVWKNSFDQTQRSLSENLFNLGQYLKTGLRWVTVQELGRVGLQHLMERFPWQRPGAAGE
jgi:hypothetical protein